MTETREEAAPPEPESDVRADEWARGIDQPILASALPDEVVAELRKPLDPNRVRRRKGRGSGQFEYLAGHDVKRRANELFGFGNWGAEVVELEEEEAVEVMGGGDSPRPGWHVCYLAVVRVHVRGCLPCSDVGYGDGVEYGPAAKATARELASKEAVTDAIKRALTQWGDQFGLILYAKADEKQRIDRDRNADDSRPITRRQEKAGLDPGAPKSFAEILERLVAVLGGTDVDRESAKWWLAEAATAKYGAPVRDLPTAQRDLAGQTLGRVIMILEESHPDLSFAGDVRKIVNTVCAECLDGVVLDGPPWSLDPTDAAAGLPTYDTWAAEHAPAAEDEAGVS